jgi:hypothetical protein
MGSCRFKQPLAGETVGINLSGQKNASYCIEVQGIFLLRQINPHPVKPVKSEAGLRKLKQSRAAEGTYSIRRYLRAWRSTYQSV